MGQTIFGVSSGRGRAGVAVVRISGRQARAGLQKLCKRVPANRQASLRVLYDPDTDEIIDSGLVLWMPGPSSFTGEDCAELQVHGSQAVLAKLLEVLGGFAEYRPSEAGEFTRRALLNGRIDLVEVEGLADLLEARTELQRRQAVGQALGVASNMYEGWRNQLINILALLEANIDFSDEEDIENSDLLDLRCQLETLSGDISSRLRHDKCGEQIREGLRVVLAGPPNVGKSTLFNRLAAREAAMVSPLAGTTRDTIEVYMDINGLPVLLIDTAGLHEEPADALESEGMARTRNRLRDADLVLWVCACGDSGDPVQVKTDSNTLRIINKTDLRPEMAKAVPGEQGNEGVMVSAKTGFGMNRLVSAISTRLQNIVDVSEPAVVVRDRHQTTLMSVTEHLDDALANGSGRLELMCEEVRLAATELGRLTGRVDVEELLDVIFRDFCIGK